jgi:formylglycine-generating enzyme required for sulfatase activity
MKPKYLLPTAAVALGLAGWLLASWYSGLEREEQLRFRRRETQLIVSVSRQSSRRLFKAGKNLQEAREIALPESGKLWLPEGNYFLRIEQQGRISFCPAPVLGFRSGPDPDGSLTVTVRSPPVKIPRHLGSPDFVYISGGQALIGDRMSPRELHYVFVSAFFASPCEVTNEEFRQFTADPGGYGDDSNWTGEGKAWKAASHSQASARLTAGDADFGRFGRPELPVVKVNWFEANAYAQWLTRKVGNNEWIYGLPTDAEWEKAARGPDSFDYGLSMFISDAEIPLYDWRKNPGVPVTTVPCQAPGYSPNRYGLYHLSGNAAEWTQSLYRPYNKQTPLRRRRSEP